MKSSVEPDALPPSQETCNAELQRVKRQLSQSESERRQAAEYGLKLLEIQTEMQNRFYEEQQEMANKLEVLEQQRFAASQEATLKSSLLSSLTAEYEAHKTENKNKIQDLEARIERGTTKRTHSLQAALVRQQSETEDAQLALRHFQERMGQMETELATYKGNMQAWATVQNKGATEEEDDSAIMASLQQEKVLLTEKCENLQSRVEQADTTAAMLHQQLERLQCEHEEVSAEAVSYFNALEKARESQQELQIQLDQARQQAQDPNSRGNSLFAEVEDRRAKTERELVGLRMRHTTLQDQYKFNKEMLHRTKMQFGTLLQMRGDQESSVMQRMRSEYISCKRELAESIQKNQQLQEQLHKADKKRETPVRGDAGDGKYYMKLLKLKVKELKQESASLRDEVSVHRLKALSESQRSVELERHCLLAERSQHSAQGHNFALQQQIHQLRQKYEPQEIDKDVVRGSRKECLPFQPEGNSTENLQVSPHTLLQAGVLKASVNRATVNVIGVLRQPQTTESKRSKIGVVAVAEEGRNTKDRLSQDLNENIKKGDEKSCSDSESTAIPARQPRTLKEKPEQPAKVLAADNRLPTDMPKDKEFNVIHVGSQPTVAERQCAQQ